jgi:hypothetical protein
LLVKNDEEWLKNLGFGGETMFVVKGFLAWGFVLPLLLALQNPFSRPTVHLQTISANHLSPSISQPNP